MRHEYEQPQVAPSDHELLVDCVRSFIIKVASVTAKTSLKNDHLALVSCPLLSVEHWIDPGNGRSTNSLDSWGCVVWVQGSGHVAAFLAGASDVPGARACFGGSGYPGGTSIVAKLWGQPRIRVPDTRTVPQCFGEARPNY